jgi:hypothetical protein
METIKEEVPVIDRKKMKEAMTAYTPMVNYLNAMVKLTGGLLSYDLRNNMKEREGDNTWRQVFVYKFSNGHEMEECTYFRHTPIESELTMMLDIAKNGTEDDWLKLLCVLYRTFEFQGTSVGFHEVEAEGYGGRRYMNKVEHHDITLLIQPTAIRQRVAKWVKEMHSEVWSSKTVNHGL